MDGPLIEIVPAGQALATERNKATRTAHYDVVCSRCGPVVQDKMYPTACAEKNDHLCNPNRPHRDRSKPLQDAVDRAQQKSS